MEVEGKRPNEIYIGAGEGPGDARLMLAAHVKGIPPTFSRPSVRDKNRLQEMSSARCHIVRNRE